MNRKRLPIKWLTRLVVVMLLPGLSGCVEVSDYTLTGHLWNGDYESDRHFATTNAAPGLFQTKDGKDILVRYIEGRDRDFVTKRRAYLLYKNQALIDAGKCPVFVNAKKADNLPPILMMSGQATNGYSDSPVMRGVMDSDGQHFTLVTSGREIGKHALPVYFTEDRRSERVALTPLAVAGDIVIYSAIAGAIAGVALLFIYANSQGSK